VKLALAEFLITGPPDAAMDPAWDSIISKSTGIRLQAYDAGGKITSAMWVDRHGRPHNPYGPAGIWLWPSGTVRALEWHIAGRLHRPLAAGPAIIRYDEAGNVAGQQFVDSSLGPR
jgi:hypothetical protein